MWMVDYTAAGSNLPGAEALRSTIYITSHNVTPWTLSCGPAEYYLLDGLYAFAGIVLYWVLVTTRLFSGTMRCLLPTHLYFTPSFPLARIRILTTSSLPLTGPRKRRS